MFAALRGSGTSQLGLKVFQEKEVVGLVQVIEQFLCINVSRGLGRESLETPTNHIVAKLIADQSEDQRLALATRMKDERLKNASPPVIVREHDALLDDVAGIPVATEGAQIASDGVEN